MAIVSCEETLPCPAPPTNDEGPFIKKECPARRETQQSRSDQHAGDAVDTEKNDDVVLTSDAGLAMKGSSQDQYGTRSRYCHQSS